MTTDHDSPPFKLIEFKGSAWATHISLQNYEGVEVCSFTSEESENDPRTIANAQFALRALDYHTELAQVMTYLIMAISTHGWAVNSDEPDVIGRAKSVMDRMQKEKLQIEQQQ